MDEEDSLRLRHYVLREDEPKPENADLREPLHTEWDPATGQLHVFTLEYRLSMHDLMTRAVARDNAAAVLRIAQSRQRRARRKVDLQHVARAYKKALNETRDRGERGIYELMRHEFGRSPGHLRNLVAQARAEGLLPPTTGRRPNA